MITDEDVAAPIRAQDGAAPAAVLQDDPDLARMRFGEPPDGRDAASALQDVAIGGGLLSFLTFGLYRFWMKTWRRQVVWRETRIGGEGFEYTGEPYELMLGSMLAVTVLSLLIGTANMAATYLQISLAAGFQAALFVSVPLLLPIGQWAIYRARRYRLLRSKWRGVRAGMDGSGWRYLGVWALWTVIEIASVIDTRTEMVIVVVAIETEIVIEIEIVTTK